MPASFKEWAEHYGYDPDSEDAEVDYQRYLDELAALESVVAKQDEADQADHVGMTWWNRLTERERRHWLDVAGSARPSDAFRAFQEGRG